MKKISKKILLEEAKKESNMTLRDAIISRVDFELEWYCRKNMRKDWRQAYGIIKKRFASAHEGEIKPNVLFLINYFWRNYIIVNHMAREWWEFDGFESQKEAEKIYNIAAIFLTGIYNSILEGQYDLNCHSYKNHWHDWHKEID